MASSTAHDGVARESVMTGRRAEVVSVKDAESVSQAAAKEVVACARAVLRQGPLDPERLPSQLIRPAAGRLVWLVDSAAASRLVEMGTAGS